MSGPLSLPQRVLHEVRSSAFCVKFYYRLIPLRSSRSCSCLLLRLLFLPILLAPTCFRRQFLFKCGQKSLSPFVLLHVGCVHAYLSLRNTSPSFTTIGLSSPAFSRTTLQNFQVISDLHTELSKFQHQKKMCS